MENDTFDVEKMFLYSKKAIEDFAKEHQSETFYAFSIDASLLCLNSQERFNETLNAYQEKYPQYFTKETDTEALKYNTGDWKYQGFASLSVQDGFNEELYQEHYDIPFEHKTYDEEKLALLFSKTPYHLAMSQLLEKLIQSGVFEKLNKTNDFKCFLSEHEY